MAADDERPTATQAPDQFGQRRMLQYVIEISEHQVAAQYEIERCTQTPAPHIVRDEADAVFVLGFQAIRAAGRGKLLKPRLGRQFAQAARRVTGARGALQHRWIDV